MPTVFEGDHRGKNFTFAIIVSRFNEFVTKRLLEGALDCLREKGVAEKNIAVVYCPGAFEIPQAAQRMAETKRYDAVICLGCVIRGDTPHFEYIAAAAAQGVEHASRTTGIPMSFGVLTTDNFEQAVERAGAKGGNKGWEAALSALEMASVFSTIRKSKGK
jgi:6,7-dimethyl-8-ribityllumazine synthase